MTKEVTKLAGKEKKPNNSVKPKGKNREGRWGYRVWKSLRSSLHILGTHVPQGSLVFSFHAYSHGYLPEGPATASLRGWPEGAVPPAKDGWDRPSPLTHGGSPTGTWQAAPRATMDGGDTLIVKRRQQAEGNRPG